tara:strand:- start:14 stop:295 length:282 start_codon:yes stop_codon:yes gene_type:complete
MKKLINEAIKLEARHKQLTEDLGGDFNAQEMADEFYRIKREAATLIHTISGWYTENNYDIEDFKNLIARCIEIIDYAETEIDILDDLLLDERI